MLFLSVGSLELASQGSYLFGVTVLDPSSLAKIVIQYVVCCSLPYIEGIPVGVSLTLPPLLK